MVSFICRMCNLLEIILCISHKIKATAEGRMMAMSPSYKSSLDKPKKLRKSVVKTRTLIIIDTLIAISSL